MAIVSQIVLSLLLAANGGTTTSQFGFVSAISFSRSGFAGLPRYHQAESLSTLFGMRGGGLFGGKNDAAAAASTAASAAATATAET
jgi:hypothetical protein